jgi:hypothetical protein
MGVLNHHSAKHKIVHTSDIDVFKECLESHCAQVDSKFCVFQSAKGRAERECVRTGRRRNNRIGLDMDTSGGIVSRKLEVADCDTRKVVESLERNLFRQGDFVKVDS